MRAGPQMGHLLGSLEWGVKSLDAEVAQASLEALAALAKSHYEATTRQHQQQGNHTAMPAFTGGVSGTT